MTTLETWIVIFWVAMFLGVALACGLLFSSIDLFGPLEEDDDDRQPGWTEEEIEAMGKDWQI